MRHPNPLAIACLALVGSCLTTAHADEWVLPDRSYTNVVITESDRAFYVLIPEDGSVQPVPKTAETEAAQIIVASEPERDRLRNDWREKHDARRDAALKEKELARSMSEAVQDRRALGLRIAEEDLKRLAKNDTRFDRFDRRWRRSEVSEEALRLLLSGEDEATIQLAAMSADAQFVAQFVNMDLVTRVKQAWLRQGWQHKQDDEREQALTVVTAIVKREATTSLERDATMAYIHRHVEEWK